MIIHEYTDFSSNIALTELIAEYMKSLPFDIAYQSPGKELEDLSSLYSNDKGGAIIVAEENGILAGCVAVKGIEHLHPIEGIRVCEMKRLYVRPEFRGRNLGQQLAKVIVKKAIELGYHKMYLDTHRVAQKIAIEMYRKMGFVECADYHANPEKLLCFELSLLNEQQRVQRSHSI